jgi:putative transposase
VLANQADYPVRTMCRVLGVSTSGFYEWVLRPKSRRALEDEVLLEVIRRAYTDTRDSYGYRRMWDELKEEYGIEVGRDRVRRIMRANEIVGLIRRKFRRTTLRDEARRPAPDLIDRDFTATAPDERWVADITYVRTWSGWLYLAVVLDLFSRRVVGWSVAPHLRTELVTHALRMAVARRRPSGIVIHHSDQGSQYVSYDFEKACRAAGIVRSMGSTGDCFDNAAAESFFATLECELLDRVPFRNRNEARIEIHDYIECFYNQRRRHSSLGNVSPVNYERRWRESNNFGDAA